MIPLSEAMALGRVLLKPKAMFLTDGEGSGCALGMALTAVGVKDRKAFFHRRAHNTMALAKEVLRASLLLRRFILFLRSSDSAHI